MLDQKKKKRSDFKSKINYGTIKWMELKTFIVLGYLIDYAKASDSIVVKRCEKWGNIMGFGWKQ